MLTIEVATWGEEKKKLIYPFTFTPLHFLFNIYFESPPFSCSHVFFGLAKCLTKVQNLLQET